MKKNLLICLLLNILFLSKVYTQSYFKLLDSIRVYNMEIYNNDMFLTTYEYVNSEWRRLILRFDPLATNPVVDTLYNGLSSFSQLYSFVINDNILYAYEGYVFDFYTGNIATFPNGIKAIDLSNDSLFNFYVIEDYTINGYQGVYNLIPHCLASDLFVYDNFLYYDYEQHFYKIDINNPQTPILLNSDFYFYKSMVENDDLFFTKSTFNNYSYSDLTDIHKLNLSNSSTNSTKIATVPEFVKSMVVIENKLFFTMSLPDACITFSGNEDTIFQPGIFKVNLNEENQAASYHMFSNKGFSHLAKDEEYLYAYSDYEKTIYAFDLDTVIANIDVDVNDTLDYLNNYNLYNVNNKFIEVFPNPAKDYLNIKNFDNLKNYSYSLYNVNGIVISNHFLTEPSLNIKDLNKGVYYLKFENTPILKFIKI